MSNTVFAGPYTITKDNIRKTYAIMEDSNIQMRTYKGNTLVKTKNLP